MSSEQGHLFKSIGDECTHPHRQAATSAICLYGEPHTLLAQRIHRGQYRIVMTAERDSFNLLMLEEGEWLLQDLKCSLFIFRNTADLDDDEDVVEEIEVG